MLTAGSVLKKERLKKNYTLDEVASATKIQKQYIEAIEENEFNRFPSSVYAKGFLQNYAKFLNLNAGRILALYRRSVGEAPPEIVKEAQKPLKPPKLVITPKLLIVIIISLFILGVLSYLIYQFYQFQKPPMLDITKPKGNDIVVNEEEYTIEGKTDPGMFVTVDDEPVKVTSTGEFKVTVTLSVGTNTIVIKSRHPDNTENEASVPINIEYKPKASAQSEEEESEQQAQDDNPAKFDVELKILTDAAWIMVLVDDVQEQAGILGPNATFNFTPQKTIYISTGKVTSTQLKINGELKEFFVDTTGVGTIECEIDSTGEISCIQP